MRGANPHHESNADLYALDLPVELEAQESAVSPKLHSGCFKTTDKLIASLRRTFLCGADTRGNESWRGLQRQTPRNNIPCITTCFDHSRADEETLAPKLGVAHPFFVGLEVVHGLADFFLDVFLASRYPLIGFITRFTFPLVCLFGR